MSFMMQTKCFFFFFKLLGWKKTNILLQHHNKHSVLLRIFFWFTVKPLRARSKVHIFWEGCKILRNLHQLFVLYAASQIFGGDFTKFCGLLRIHKLYRDQFHLLKMMTMNKCSIWMRMKKCKNFYPLINLKDILWSLGIHITFNFMF